MSDEIVNEMEPNAPISDPYLVIREYRCVIADYTAEFRQLRTEIDEKAERIRQLQAENARLRESLQTHNNAGIDVTMQLHALREAVAGLADEWREEFQNYRERRKAPSFRAVMDSRMIMLKLVK